IMLCVKYLLAQKMSLPTVIFDEIDTGVSGDVAARMAELMKKMSHYMQVIAITHLPQVAAKGVSHYKVYKSDTEDSTVSTIVKLDYDQRVMELAAMLGDSKIGEAAISNAKSLLESSKL
ncbi:MAG: DNA repair protein RecN, partial [Muribaculaceae bacterium]|nr:DNA repair protein RecN [Muribaculaceae bacterium]